MGNMKRKKKYDWRTIQVRGELYRVLEIKADKAGLKVSPFAGGLLRWAMVYRKVKKR